MPYPQIKCDTEGPIGFQVLNNPEKIDALSTVMIGEPTGASRIAETGAMAIGYGKQVFCQQVDRGDEKAPAHGVRTIALNCLAEDARIGIHDFPEKIAPEWKDR